MKRLVIIIFISLIILGLPIFFWIKNKNDLVNRQTLIPRFSTSDLPSGKVGEYYEAELIATLVGAKAKLKIAVLQLPQGISLNDCKQEYNFDLIPKPNTIIKCNLSGYPENSEFFESSFELSAIGYSNNVVGKYKINITQ